MSVKKVIMNRAHYIEKLLSENSFYDIGNHLTELEAVDMTIAYLQETDVTKAVYRVLKNCPTVALKKKAKHLLSKWKALYKNNYLPAKQDKMSVPENEKEDTKHHSMVPKEQAEVFQVQNQHELVDPTGINSLQCSDFGKDALCNAPEGSEDQLELLESSKSISSETSPPRDHVMTMRSKCTELLLTALTDSATSKEESEKQQELAKEIEEHIFVLHGGNDRKYKNCIRSKISNLKNPKNSHLKHTLLLGTVTPKAFAEMTVMEMANDELKKLRASYTQSSVQEHQLPQAINGTQTNKIKCRRCEKFDCTVTMIARGALFLPSWVRNANPDEQMMTYVICNECGEQWYHSRWISL
uniref:Transcription elongation factor A N-terminal and central domain containing n=1 Tax=Sphenodon punctatus TaxID=8508 RepID=A0A8D0GDY7_SPHPU